MAICLDFDWQTNEFMVYCRTSPVMGFALYNTPKGKRKDMIPLNGLLFQDRYGSIIFTLKIKIGKFAGDVFCNGKMHSLVCAAHFLQKEGT